MSEASVQTTFQTLPRECPGARGRPADMGLWKAAQQFEAIFASQFVKAMRSSEPQEGITEESAGREVFNDLFSEAIARNMVESGAFGLTPSIYRHLGGRFVAGAAGTAAPRAPITEND